MSHRYRTRGDQLFSFNPSQALARLGEIGGLQACVLALLPLAARPYNWHQDSSGGQTHLDLYAGGEPEKAQRQNADGTYTALAIVNSASPAANELGWQRVAATAKVSLYTNVADTQMVAIEFYASGFKADIVALLASTAPS